jgi:hypothetical protein
MTPDQALDKAAEALDNAESFAVGNNTIATTYVNIAKEWMSLANELKVVPV